jgi:hypothetical protein
MREKLTEKLHAENGMLINLWAIENMASIIIVDEKSPIIYKAQTNGCACSHPEIKGYLVPVEFKGNISEKFLNEKYSGSGWELDESFYGDVPEIMKQLQDYFCEEYAFWFDDNKRDKNTESWVYLTGKRIRPAKKYQGILEGFRDTFDAVLTWPNSD